MIFVIDLILRLFLDKKARFFLNTLELAHAIVDILTDRKGEDILLLDIRDETSLADYFLICSGTSIRMVSALAKTVRKEIKQKYGLYPKLEGEASAGWVLVDYGDLILHIFSPDRREFYNLEELWSEAKTILHVQ